LAQVFLIPLSMRFCYFFLSLSLGFSAYAQDTTDSTLASLVRTSYVTGRLSSSAFEDKRILAAAEDAASFVASRGELRGVYLEAALVWLYQWPALSSATDMELAEAILVHSR